VSAELGQSAVLAGTPAGQARASRAAAVAIPVGGGKGGVGKTFLVANLAAALARAGHRVVAADADLEGANLHTCVGVADPGPSLADFVAGRSDDVRSLLVDTPIRNLRILAATHGNFGHAQPSQVDRVRLMRQLRELDADFVLLDLGAGTHPAVIDYFMIGEAGIVVITPEPTSLENAYAFLRAAFYRRLQLAMLSHRVRDLVALAMDERNERGIRTPFDLLREVRALDPSEGARFVETMRAFRPRLIVNEARTADDVKLGFSVRSVCRKFFGIDAEYLGYVNHDEAARRSVRSRRPVVEAHPRSDAAIYIERVARKLVAGLGRPGLAAEDEL
jgi:flagellar biosynthesis protein FlhG